MYQMSDFYDYFNWILLYRFLATCAILYLNINKGYYFSNKMNNEIVYVDLIVLIGNTFNVLFSKQQDISNAYTNTLIHSEFLEMMLIYYILLNFGYIQNMK